MDSTDFDTNSLLQGKDLNSLISQSFQPYAVFFTTFTIISIFLTILILVLWILGMVRRRKVQAAIFDIQAVLHEMNEREKSRLAPSALTPSDTPKPGTDPKNIASATSTE